MCKVVSVALITGLLVGVVVGVVTWLVMRDVKTQEELRELDWWEHTVIYQIYPRSFKDSDGDGIGDLKGITNELQHLVNAGVGAIWMSPIFKSPMIDFGYDISDFYDIHEEYGTMRDFEELVAAAHSLGLKVLLDYVPNHASTESEYFKFSEDRVPGYEDYFVWADPRPDPNNPDSRLVPSNWISQFGGSVWEWSDKRQQFYLHQFAIEQADFNFRKQAVRDMAGVVKSYSDGCEGGIVPKKAVRDEMIKIMIFWIEKGADGFRVDAIPHLFETEADENGIYPNEPLSGNMFLTPDQPGYTTQEHVRDLKELYDVVYEWREAVDNWKDLNNKTTKVLLAEAYADIYNTMLYYGDEQGRVGAHFPFNFDFITTLNAGSNARDFAFIIKRWLSYMPKGNVANWVFGNHDQSRMPSRFRTNMVDGLNGLNMLLPGVAVTYQGEEIGMRDGFVSWEDTVDVAAINQGDEETYLQYSRDPCRTPYHWDDSRNAGFSTAERTWLPVADDYREINLRAQEAATRSHFKVYQALTALRKEPSLSHGDYHVDALTQNTLVLVRYLRSYDTYALVFNVGDTEDIVDLSDVSLLEEPMNVVVSSVHSNRISGVTVLFGQIRLQAGEAFVLKAPPT